MNQHAAILPEKHVRTAESLLGIGALVLSILGRGVCNLDGVWKSLRHENTVKGRLNGTVTFDTLVLAVDLLYAMGMVDLDEEGRLFLCV